MIQRIQSVYLFIAGLASCMALFAPMAALWTKGFGDPMLSFRAFGYESSIPEMAGRYPHGVIIFLCLTAFIAFFAIFVFKNRKKQLSLVYTGIVCNLLACASIVAYMLSIANKFELEVGVEIYSALPLISLLSFFMACRAIKKDEALVRAANRIR